MTNNFTSYGRSNSDAEWIRKYFDGPGSEFLPATLDFAGRNLDDLLAADQAEIGLLLESAGIEPLNELGDIRAAVAEAAKSSESRDNVAALRDRLRCNDERSLPPGGVRFETSIEPEGFSEQLLRALAEHRRLILTGPAGCGKSHFLRHLFSRSEPVRQAFGRCMFVDGRALGMRDVNQFSRELLGAQFGLDDPAFRSFYEQLSFDSADGAPLGRIDPERTIKAYLLHRFPNRRGIVILDHADQFSDKGEIKQFLSRILLPAVEAHGLQVLLVQRGHPDAACRKSLDIGHVIGFPKFTVREVEAWLDASLVGKAGFKPDPETLLLRLGARPLLLDLYRCFVSSAQRERQASVDNFVFHLCRLGHVADCDRFIRAARKSPVFLGALIARKGQLSDDLVAALTPAMHEQLVLSGAVEVCGNGSNLRYVSALHEERMRVLLDPDVFAAIAMRGDVSEIRENGAWKFLRNYIELAADGTAKAIANETDPSSGLNRLIELLGQWRIEAAVYLRDPANARLWAPFHDMSALAPFRGIKQPEFAWAIGTGDTVHCDDGRWFVPIRGNSGFISMVLRVKFENASSAWSERVRLQALQSLLDGIRTTLGHVVDRLAFQFERQLMAKMAIMSRDESSGYNGLLQSLGCLGWAVLKRNGESGFWQASRVEATGKLVGAGRLANAFAESDDAAIDRHALHWTGRGVVLTGAKLREALPSLSGPQDAVYMQPLSRGEHEPRVVVFVFDLGLEGPITGVIQQKLGRLASDLVVA